MNTFLKTILISLIFVIATILISNTDFVKQLIIAFVCYTGIQIIIFDLFGGFKKK